MTKILVDTNLLIYALDLKSKYFNATVKLLNNSEYTFYITSKNISEYFAVSTKLKINSSIIFGFYEEVKRNMLVLFPTGESLLVLEKLLNKYKVAGNKVYDLEIVSVMLANNIRKIATFNERDFSEIDEVEISLS